MHFILNTVFLFYYSNYSYNAKETLDIQFSFKVFSSFLILVIIKSLLIQYI